MKILRLTFKTELTEHDGYCSAPYDERVTFSSIDIYEIVDENFKDYDLGPVELTDIHLDNYLLLTMGCDLGSNYCGLGLQKSLVSAEISMSTKPPDILEFIKHRRCNYRATVIKSVLNGVIEVPESDNDYWRKLPGYIEYDEVRNREKYEVNGEVYLEMCGAVGGGLVDG